MAYITPPQHRRTLSSTQPKVGMLITLRKRPDVQVTLLELIKRVGRADSGSETWLTTQGVLRVYRQLAGTTMGVIISHETQAAAGRWSDWRGCGEDAVIDDGAHQATTAQNFQALADRLRQEDPLTIRELITRCGGQTKAAAICGVHRQTVHHWHNGRSAPPWTAFLAMCRATKTDPARFI